MTRQDVIRSDQRKSDRQMACFRLAKTGIAAIDQLAAAESVDRTEMVRRILAFGIRNMPKG